LSGSGFSVGNIDGFVVVHKRLFMKLSILTIKNRMGCVNIQRKSSRPGDKYFFGPITKIKGVGFVSETLADGPKNKKIKT
jgi:hypothetical protein